MIFSDLQENYTKVLYTPKLKDEICSLKLNACEETFEEKTFKKIGGLFTALVLTSAVYFNLDTTAYASNLTDKAEGFYFGTFMNIAKWVIVIKGGWDIIAKTLKEDFEGAKKSIVQYVVVFAVLMGLPWALEMVEEIFAGEV